MRLPFVFEYNSDLVAFDRYAPLMVLAREVIARYGNRVAYQSKAMLFSAAIDTQLTCFEIFALLFSISFLCPAGSELRPRPTS